MEGHGEMGLMGENFDPSVLGRIREDGYESRSGSDNLEGGSGDEQEVGGDTPGRKKRYHRHTPYQIQQLEAFFKENPHPDEKARLEIGRKLTLESKQVKFWFQNRRTQMKTQLERHENVILRQENNKLRIENIAIKDAMRSPICSSCGGPAVLGEISIEEHQLRIENARLKDELNRICSLANKFVGGPLSSLSGSIPSSLANSSLELAIGRHGFGSLNSVDTTLPMGLDFGNGVSNSLPVMPSTRPIMGTTGVDIPFEKSMFMELALASMDELVKLSQIDYPLWVRSLNGGREALNYEEYMRAFPPCIGMKASGFITDATRATGVVISNSLAIVETLMDANRWAETFSCLIGRTSTIDVISSGMTGTRSGALQLMHAELQVLSPLVPARQLKFIRFCKQHAEGVWAVVDVSVDTIQEGSNARPSMNCRRLPSGCIVQDMSNGYSKITWVEHWEYDESAVHHLYRPLLSSGMGFGAQRWIATLQRQCECLAVLLSSTVPGEDQTAITPSGRRSIVKLAQRMTRNFYAGVCATVHNWEVLQVGNVSEDAKLMTRKNVDDPGEPPGVVLSATMSVWMPVSRQRLFDFLRNEQLRNEWDILSHGGPMQEMIHIAKGQDRGNSVSLVRASSVPGNANQSSMLILQETWTDASGSLITYAPVDIPAMQVVINGGDSTCVALLPSGFAIVPDGFPDSSGPNNCNGTVAMEGSGGSGGSLLTVGFQILVNNLPSSKLTMESVETVNDLISQQIQKIKAALRCN
ncbi:homeobox-leucine zipper protein ANTHOCYANINLESS 2 isoform X2 [Cornus florida]|nr:homeobox-leucine zipper protein ANTHOCYANINLESS 2 isoform X2 [Cornus florida]